ncbi:MAG TPA: LamG-like jellyroll fold domain-containing protein, partial [Dongiaceae bacterium]|nr:LamG-like jellyroll fold domain-containing protein [Dongiaceae bacterium]
QVSYLYVNGALVAQNSGTTDTPADLGGTLNDWLGRSQYGDPLFNGAIDEFRIWQGQLSPFQVAIDAASGPDKILVGPPGPAQALRLTLNTNMIRGGQQNATVIADFTGLTGVNVSSVGTTYTSSSTNVATVNANGLIQAVDAGTTTITATFSNLTASQVITVTVKPTILAHRWNFNETSGTTVHDLVGTANGTLSATGAALDGTNVTLDGLAGYVDLPGHLIDGFDAVTFEAWVNVDPNTLTDTAARLFEFGSVDAVNELGFTALTAGGNPGNASAQYYNASGNLAAMRHQGLNTLGKVHLVVNFNPPLGTIDFFLNGHWQNTVTNLNFSLAGITNLSSRLGANLGGTDFTAATIDEFRIYNGALDLFGIRANFAAGPNLVATNLGAPTSLTLKIDPSMVQGSRSIPHAWAAFASVTNVDVTQTADVTYSSSDPTVVSITPDGLVEAVGPGSATVTAALGGLKTAKPVTVFTTQTMLVHRYSFTSDASDSVGAQDGYLWGNATISGAQVVFDGDPNSYVELPSRMISSYDSVTFEFWASVGVNAIWSRIFDFGHYTAQADGGGQSYVFFTPHSGTPTTRICLSDGTEANLDCGPPLDGYDDVHLVVVYDPTTDTESLYTNAVLAASGGLAGKKLSGVNDVACWLGRSLYAADNGLTASIDEFRLYAGALTPAQITADYAAGPNTVVLPPPAPAAPALSASSSRGNIVITWPATATGFSLVSAPGLAAPVVWSPVGIAPVVTNGMNEVTVPTTNQAAYFRLKK